MNAEEIKKNIDDMSFYEIDMYTFYINQKIDSDLVEMYNKYKGDNNIISLPEYITMDFKNRLKWQKLKNFANVTDFEIPDIIGFKVDSHLGCNLFYLVCSDETASSIYMDNEMKQKTLEYFYDKEQKEENRLKAKKGCYFENQDIIITDPCYIFDYDKTDGYTDFSYLGMKNYIEHSTLYGDWSCTTYNTDTNEPIGNFCADAGRVCVVTLEDAIKANDGYEDIKDKEWTRTIIRNFTGHIYADFKTEKGVYDEDTPYHKKGEEWSIEYLELVGEGNINFRTKQTGL